MLDKPLDNITLWITRPRGQADQLGDMLRKKGAEVLHLPMIQIEQIPVDKKMTATVKKLKDFDMVFFISTNAAHFAMELMETELTKFPDKPLYFAPGPTTAKVLEAYGLKAVYPEKATSTEALLILPEIRKCLEKKSRKKKQALIFRGKGGRELLAKSLKAKGVEVTYLELYKRKLPSFSELYIQEIINKKKPDGIVFSSAEALHNFISLFDGVYSGYKAIPIFVSSERLQILARKLGFETIKLLKAAHDNSVVRGVEEAHG